jgi:hypothetical protein
MNNAAPCRGALRPDRVLKEKFRPRGRKKGGDRGVPGAAPSLLISYSRLKCLKYRIEGLSGAGNGAGSEFVCSELYSQINRSKVKEPGAPDASGRGGAGRVGGSRRCGVSRRLHIIRAKSPSPAPELRKGDGEKEKKPKRFFIRKVFPPRGGKGAKRMIVDFSRLKNKGSRFFPSRFLGKTPREAKIVSASV